MSSIALVLYQFMYHPPTYDQLHVRGKSKRQQLAELDYAGISLFTVGMVLFLISLSWGGTTYPWGSYQVLLTLIFGILTLTGLIFYGKLSLITNLHFINTLPEAYIVRQTALIPIHLFKNIGYDAIVGCATIGAMVYYSLSVLWPTIIFQVYTTSSITIGFQSSVIGGGILLGQILSGLSITYVPKVKYQTVIASCLAFAFVTALASLSEDAHARFIIFGILACVAIGFVDNITFPGVTLVIEPQDIGLASGVLGSIRAAGGGIAQALYLNVLNNRLAVYTPQYVTSAVVSAGLPASSLPSLFDGITAGNFSSVLGMTPEVEAVVNTQVRRAYVESFRIVFYVTVPFSAALILAACFVPNMEKFLGENVAKRLQGGSESLQGAGSSGGEQKKEDAV